MKTDGTHVIADVWLEETLPMAGIIKLMKSSAKSSGMKIVAECFREFGGEAFTGVLVLAESHYSVHYFPERNYMAVDCFTCGEEGKALQAVSTFAAAINPAALGIRQISRGRNP